ncbi:hypothetical protein DSO57_1000146 [Entomophthora muscae]|uniref:Uncharacterized protein n=1 Tax=Entomophthora muscae TaxID=34485 RepID=A0ACC2T945_9FUNG|nr:hypothetical protein DSO57_1000146 [Entomophthora muscae]
MWILVSIYLLFWSSSPVFWRKLSLISQTPDFAPGLLYNVIGHLNQVPTNLASYVLFPWSASYPEGLLPPPESRTTETPFSDFADPLPTAVSAPSLPFLYQIPMLDPDAPPTWDCSLWLLTGALVMALDAYFPPLSQPVSFGRPLQAAIPFLHWMSSWWLVPSRWEPDFVSLAPLSYMYVGKQKPWPLNTMKSTSTSSKNLMISF